MEDLIGDLTAVPQPIEIKLYGTNPTQLDAQADKVARAIGGINGVVEIKSGVQLAGDALGDETIVALPGGRLSLCHPV
ncbi:MAG: hypothetical protein WDW38_004636 [Sanguina aurantia]